MAEPLLCPECSSQIAPQLVACPNCGFLVHGSRLQELAESARHFEGEANLPEALSRWRDALMLLPPQSRQAQRIAERVEALSRKVEEVAPASKKPAWARRGGMLTAAALLLWKFKVVFAFLLTKGKVLLLGLSKGSTFFSMLLTAGIYWKLFGLEFGIGFVLAIYVHEMGHVVALQQRGIAASAPMFIPGFGAVVRAKQYPVSPREDARVGLAGPLWGLGAVVVAWLLAEVSGRQSLFAIARFSAWVNLFNLLPVWQLDGGRGFRALDRAQRWLVVAAIAMIWFVTEEGLLLLIGLAGGARTLLQKDAPQEGDWRACMEFIFLAAALTGFAQIPVPGLELAVGGD